MSDHRAAVCDVNHSWNRFFIPSFVSLKPRWRDQTFEPHRMRVSEIGENTDMMDGRLIMDWEEAL
ncbi:MAG: hypothetical protein AB7G68_00170 [Nitrospiraceae bacterium]